MPSYRAPLREYSFLFHDVLGFDRLTNLPDFADATPDVVDAVMEGAGKLAENVLFPLNRSGDEEGCTRHDDGSVSMPAGFKDAYQAYAEGGWCGIAADPEFGGSGLPSVLNVALSEMVTSANAAFGLTPGLVHGAYSAILKHGSDEQKATYLPRLISGEWTGTMNLTEPHCGTDLGLLRTKAVPRADGTHLISGTKIFISGGDHDMTPNIVHLVLARIEGASEGTKGISLFIVPKFLVNEDGSLGERNAVTCGSIEEKMGMHGSATCVMNYDGAIGYLVGPPNKGLNAMFTMMNEARIMVGTQGVGFSEVAYQNALDYAKDRLQGRSLTAAPDQDRKPVPIIVHPDVRRMLMNQKAFTEGGRALTLWAGILSDLAEHGQSAEEREEAEERLSLMTPIIKAFLTDRGFEACVTAQQIFGGHGYVQEWGMEQYVRDARISMVYEGANGIQGLDLVGRKLPANQGRAAKSFLGDLERFIADRQGDAMLGDLVKGLKVSKERLEDAAQWLQKEVPNDPENIGASSHDFLHLFGLTMLGYMWVMMAEAAQAKIDDGNTDPFYATKIKTARYYMERVLPEGLAHLAKIKVGADPMMALDADEF